MLYSWTRSSRDQSIRWFKFETVELLDYTYTSLDEAKLNELLMCHPYMMTEAKEQMRDWILGLQPSSPLFSKGVVPNGVDMFKGQQFSTVFKRVLSKFQYWGDHQDCENVKRHLDNLEVAIAHIKSNLASVKSAIASQLSSGVANNLQTTTTTRMYEYDSARQRPEDREAISRLENEVARLREQLQQKQKTKQ